jgi:hypothetical protein
MMTTHADNFPQYIPNGTEECLRAYSAAILSSVGNNRLAYAEARERLVELTDYMQERLVPVNPYKDMVEDQPVYVRNSENLPWERRHFSHARLIGGSLWEAYTYYGGTTSFTQVREPSSWNICITVKEYNELMEKK